jgi:stage II sporulation protein D
MLKKTYFIFILKFFLLFLIFSFTVEKVAICAHIDKVFFTKAKNMLNQGKYLEAVGIYQEIAEFSTDPDIKAKALFFIGRTYSLYLDQYPAAIKQFDLIIKNFPDSHVASDAMFNSGMVFFEQGNHKKAYKYFGRYLKDYPNGRHFQTAAVWADSSKTLIKSYKVKPSSTKKPKILNEFVRVLLKKDVDKVTINSDNNITLLNPYSGKKIYHGKGPVIFKKNNGYLSINSQIRKIRTCTVKSDSATLKLEKTPYRGAFLIIAERKGLSVVNSVQMEHYLLGVVPKEMPAFWAKQALMAQAVASRTYAMYVREKSKNKQYDIEATKLSQVYGGYNAESPRSSIAINETRDQVMTHDGKFIVAYFHSNSGGHTESPKNVWKADVPYLRAVPDKFSKNVPGSNWEYFLSNEDTCENLARDGFFLGDIHNLKTLGQSSSGRTLKVIISSEKGTYKMSSNNFRITIGSNKIKSTLFNAFTFSDGIFLQGKGFGHGVGMSQWGARRMAQKGANYKDILKHYYQNIEIAQIDK